MRVAVVGAGLSGLAAALRLQRREHEVLVLESAHRPGGRVQTVRHRGFVIDLGPEVVAASYERYLEMVRTLGLGHAVVPSSPVLGSVRDGRVVEIDTARPLSTLLTPLLSTRAKLRLLRGMLGLRGALRRVNAYSLADTSDLDDPQCPASELARHRFGTEVGDYIIDPLMRIVGGTKAQAISSLVLLGGLKSWSVPLVNIVGGLDTVPQAAAHRLQVEYGATVESVDDAHDSVKITYTDARGARMTLEVDACIIATPYDEAERIYAPLRELAGSFLRNLIFTRMVDIKLAFDIRPASKAYLVQVPTVESRDLLGICLTHNKAPDRAPPGHGLFTVYTDHLAADKFFAMSEEEILAWACEETARLFPQTRGHFLFGYAHKYPKTAYLPYPGFYRRVAALIEGLRGTHRVQIAGDVFGAGSMEAAVVWGERAADRVRALGACQ